MELNPLFGKHQEFPRDSVTKTQSLNIFEIMKLIRYNHIAVVKHILASRSFDSGFRRLSKKYTNLFAKILKFSFFCIYLNQFVGTKEYQE